MLIPSNLRRWNTPLSNARSVLMTSLIHDGSFAITFQTEFEIESALVCFSFKKPHSYKLDAVSLSLEKEKSRTLVRRRSIISCNIGWLVNCIAGCWESRIMIFMVPLWSPSGTSSLTFAKAQVSLLCCDGPFVVWNHLLVPDA